MEFGNSEKEGASLSFLTFQPDTASISFHKFFAKDQAEAGTLESSAGGCIHLDEGLEDALAIFRAYADAGIDHAETHLARRRRFEDDAHTADLSELDGVGSQVQQNLPQAQGVNPDPSRQARIGSLQLQLQTALLGQWLETVEHRFHDFAQNRRLGHQRRLLTIGPGQIERRDLDLVISDGITIAVKAGFAVETKIGKPTPD